MHSLYESVRGDGLESAGRRRPDSRVITDADTQARARGVCLERGIGDEPGEARDERELTQLRKLHVGIIMRNQGGYNQGQ